MTANHQWHQPGERQPTEWACRSDQSQLLGTWLIIFGAGSLRTDILVDERTSPTASCSTALSLQSSRPTSTRSTSSTWASSRPSLLPLSVSSPRFPSGRLSCSVSLQSSLLPSPPTSSDNGSSTTALRPPKSSLCFLASAQPSRTALTRSTSSSRVKRSTAMCLPSFCWGGRSPCVWEQRGMSLF